jgi:hypothetical protein
MNGEGGKLIVSSAIHSSAFIVSASSPGYRACAINCLSTYGKMPPCR